LKEKTYLRGKTPRLTNQAVWGDVCWLNFNAIWPLRFDD